MGFQPSRSAVMGVDFGALSLPNSETEAIDMRLIFLC
jgi:hypothetical protein